MAQADPGSFRDPASHIVVDGERVLRILDDRGLQGWNALKATKFHDVAVADGRLIHSTQVSFEGAPALEHPKLDFVSYPYEWTFTMLKDAALLQLHLLAEALSEGITIKDATPFNIQFIDGRPIFIDVGSFEQYKKGEPWLGYRQFTRQFLFPLMLHAWAGIPFQPWLRGNMEGPTAADMKNLLSMGKRMRPSVFLHVSLQARMEERLEGQAVRENLGSSGFSAELILANVKKLAKLINSLEWNSDARGWVEYDSCSHVGRDRETKAEFLRAALDRQSPKRVFDLGANDGFFSEVARESGRVAIAVDGDEPVLDAVYRRGSRVNLALSDLTDMSPSQGWAGRERQSLDSRAAPDLVVAYGIVHHLIYTASVPPASIVEWLASYKCPVVVEFVTPEDEMVAKLTANKLESELHRDRTETEFRELLAKEFEIVDSKTLGEGTRVLFSLQPSRS